MEAFILIKLEPGKVKQALEAMKKMPRVVEAYAITGPDDVICRVRSADAKELSDLVISELHQVDGLQATDTRIVISL
ncbi:MAG: Lrp/AsnC family transcriptional regulator [Candidatus Geothermincolia bacterium]